MSEQSAPPRDSRTPISLTAALLSASGAAPTYQAMLEKDKYAKIALAVKPYLKQPELIHTALKLMEFEERRSMVGKATNDQHLIQVAQEIAKEIRNRHHREALEAAAKV